MFIEHDLNFLTSSRGAALLPIRMNIRFAGAQIFIPALWSINIQAPTEQRVRVNRLFPLDLIDQVAMGLMASEGFCFALLSRTSYKFSIVGCNIRHPLRFKFLSGSLRVWKQSSAE